MVKEVVFCFMFACFGFFLAFFISRTVNIAFILLLAWIPFKVLENYGLKPDWPLLHRAYDLILGLGESLIELITHLLKLASTWGMIFFLLGGITGILLHWRYKARA